MASTVIQALIVDDEPLARQVLERYIATLPNIYLAGICVNASDALQFLHRCNPCIDLLFCDIKMPEIDGLSLIKSLAQKPQVILTTAYSEFALEGFDIGVVDYLMKPIAYDRFVKAINRAIDKSGAGMAPLQAIEKKPAEYLFFKADKAFHKVFLTDICFIEAYGNYVKIHTAKQVLLVAGKISQIETQLDTTVFWRVHKSFIVALPKIDRIEGNQVLISSVVVPIGQNYRKDFLERINKNLEL